MRITYCYYLGGKAIVFYNCGWGVGREVWERLVCVCVWKALRIAQDVILRPDRLGDGQRACLTQVNNFQFHSSYKYHIKLSLLTDGYVVRLKLAGIKSVPDDSNSRCTEHNAFKHPVNTVVLLNQHMFRLSPNDSLSCTFRYIIKIKINNNNVKVPNVQNSTQHI
jgi:hypothetical protein